MLASIVIPASILLAKAVHAQNTPSVVTFISISPSPTTEEAFTIQTSIPGSMGIPPGETPIPSSLVSEAPSISTHPLRTTGSVPSAGHSAPVSDVTSVKVSPSRSGSAPAQQSTAAAPLLKSETSPLMFALAALLLV